MNTITPLLQPLYFNNSDFSFKKNQNKNYISFLGEKEEKEEKEHNKNISIPAIIGSLIGVIVPTILFAKKQKPDLKLNSFKNLWKTIDIEYELPQIIGVGLGGVLGGFLGGLADEKEKNKKAKVDEAMFQAINIALPTILVDASIKLCNKVKSLNTPLAKIPFIASSILLGVNGAVGISNVLNRLIFKKEDNIPERKFSLKNLVVHFDDLFGVLVLAKVPLAKELHFNKILPLIYTWSGYNVGDA